MCGQAFWGVSRFGQLAEVYARDHCEMLLVDYVLNTDSMFTHDADMARRHWVSDSTVCGLLRTQTHRLEYWPTPLCAAHDDAAAAAASASDAWVAWVHARNASFVNLTRRTELTRRWPHLRARNEFGGPGDDGRAHDAANGGAGSNVSNIAADGTTQAESGCSHAEPPRRSSFNEALSTGSEEPLDLAVGAARLHALKLGPNP